MGLQYTETVFPRNTNLAIPLILTNGHGMPVRYLGSLSQLRKQKGLTQTALAEIIGVEQPTIQRWEAGKREPELSQIFALAEALDVEPGALLDPTVATPIGPRLYVKGEVAAGVWKEAYELPRSDWQSFSGRSDVTAKLEHRFGLRVVGDSMNEIYPSGTIVECISVFGGVEPRPGKRVVVVRTNINGDCEATIKELVEQDGDLWLVPRSYNPAHLPIRLGDEEPGIVETRIAAVVVGSLRPE